MFYFSLYKMIFALLDADHVDDSRLPGLGVVMFIAFTILILILLFTMLIAAMVDTYHRARQLFEDNWVRKAQTIESISKDLCDEHGVLDAEFLVQN